TIFAVRFIRCIRFSSPVLQFLIFIQPVEGWTPCRTSVTGSTRVGGGASITCAMCLTFRTCCARRKGYVGETGSSSPNMKWRWLHPTSTVKSFFKMFFVAQNSAGPDRIEDGWNPEVHVVDQRRSMMNVKD